MEQRLSQLEAEQEALRRELEAVHEKQRAGDDIFRRFSESGIIGIALFELTGKILYANEALLKMIGCPPEEIAAGTARWDQLMPPECSARAAAALEELKSRGSCAPHEREYLRRDGTRFWGQFTGVSMEDKAVAFLLDVTERRQAEETNARLYCEAQSAIRLHQIMEQKLTLLSEATGALIGSLHLDQVLAEILALSRRLMEADAYAIWRLDRAAGRWGIAAAKGLSDEYQSAVIDALQHSRSMPDAPLVVSDINEEPLLDRHRSLLQKEGIRSMLVSPLLMHELLGGTLVFYFHQPHTFDDIELKVSGALANLAASAIATTELYEAASLRAEQLVEADRHKDQFLAMLAHELRNPLGAISNAIQVIQRAPPDTPAFQRAREIVERQSHHMARLVDQLLDVSRISRGIIELRPQRLDLAGLVADTCEDHRWMLEQAGLSLALELPDQPVWIEGDATWLRQIVGNLLQNAAKFTPSGGDVTVGVQTFRPSDVPGFGRFEHEHEQEHEPKTEAGKPERLGARTPERLDAPSAVVTVTDTGIGIAPELLSRLFDPFVQADRSLDRSEGGLGLGLALVKGIAELHGGRVHVHSDGIGQGATFGFDIPLPLSLADGGETEPVAPAPSEMLRVLIIEDNVDAAETMRDLVELFGHQVEVAYSGPDGVEKAGRARPDVVLCDLGLPGMDGYAVAAALRRDPGTASSRLFAVTGYGQEEDRRRSTEAGFDAHLTKPVEAEYLQQLLRSALTVGAGKKQ